MAAAFASTNCTDRHRDIHERHQRARNGAARQRHGDIRDHSARRSGTDTITAVYSGDSNFANSTSNVLSQTVDGRQALQVGTRSGRGIVLRLDRELPADPAISSAPSTTVSHKTHGKGAKKVVTSKKAVPHGGSSTKFHQTKPTAALKRSVAIISQACESENQEEVIARVAAGHETTT